MKASFTTRAKIAEGFGSFIFSLTRPRVPTSLTMQNVLAALPTRSQGDALLEFFFDEILWIYHIIHVPTVRNHFEKLYHNIENHQQPEYGQLALISTLYALAAYFSSQSSGLFFRHTESTSYCHKWTLLYGYRRSPLATNADEAASQGARRFSRCQLSIQPHHRDASKLDLHFTALDA